MRKNKVKNKKGLKRFSKTVKKPYSRKGRNTKQK